jgi:hypothetical protein
MDVGFLPLLNISTVPFLYEFEQLGSSGNSSGASLLSLRHFRRARWSWGFGLLWLLFLALTLAPTASGARHEAGLGLIATALAIQVCLWGFAIRKVKTARGAKHGE